MNILFSLFLRFSKKTILSDRFLINMLNKKLRSLLLQPEKNSNKKKFKNFFNFFIFLFVKSVLYRIKFSIKLYFIKGLNFFYMITLFEK